MKNLRKRLVLSFLILFAQTLYGGSVAISCHPSLVSDKNGRTVAVWLVTERDHTFLKSAIYVPNVGWSTPAIISTKINSVISMPQIAMNSLGEIVIAWESYNPTVEKQIIEAAFATSGEGEWTLPITISDLDENLSHDIKVSIDDNGHAMAIWCSQSKGNRDEMHVRISVAQYSCLWSAPFTLSELCNN